MLLIVTITKLFRYRRVLSSVVGLLKNMMLVCLRYQN